MKVFFGTAIFVFIACFTATYWIAGNLYLWNEFHHVEDSFTDLFVIITSYPPFSYLGIGNILMVGVIDYIVIRDIINNTLNGTWRFAEK